MKKRATKRENPTRTKLFTDNRTKAINDIKPKTSYHPIYLNQNVRKLVAENVLYDMIDYHMFGRIYAKFLRTKHVMLILRGASASGKSYSSIKALIYMALVERKNVVFFCANKNQTQFHLENINSMLVKELEKLTLQTKINLTNISKNNKSYRRITISAKKDGRMYDNEILIYGADDSEKLKHINAQNGYGFDFAVMEEANQLDRAKFFEIRNRIRNQGAKFVMLFNPVSKNNWIYDLFYQPTDNDDIKALRALSIYHHSTLYDNPHITEQQRKEREALCMTAYHKRVYLIGEWASETGTVLIEGVDFKTHPKIDFDHDHNMKIIGYGLDFGASDDTALVALYIDNNNNYYARTLLKEPISDDMVITERLEGMGIDYEALICGDSAHKSSINFLRRTYINVFGCKKYPNRINDDVATIKIMKLNMLEDDPLVDELNRVEITQGGQLGIKEHRFSHAFDALRYSLDNIKAYKRISIEKELRQRV